MSTNKNDQDLSLLVRPSHKDKFPIATVKRIMKDILQSKLEGAKYSTEYTRTIADEIRDKIRDLEVARYKIMVQVVVGEQAGEGVRMATRSLWDSMTDSYATESYINDNMFCVATAFGVYVY